MLMECEKVQCGSCPYRLFNFSLIEGLEIQNVPVLLEGLGTFRQVTDKVFKRIKIGKLNGKETLIVRFTLTSELLDHPLVESHMGDSEWWWDYLHHIRENVLVTCANMAGHMDLGAHPEELSRPILDGLLHWAVCPAAAGQDAFPTVGLNSVLSPQRLALEALCKLCVTDSNTDLLIATPPYSRLERLCGVLSRLLCRGEDQVLRELSVNLLHYLAAADSSVSRTIGMQPTCVSLLLAFVEQAEQSALGVANQLGINALRDNPESMGTSLDMLRRAAATLLHLARHPDNRPLFLQNEQRLLQLVMSQILDQQVAGVLGRVLFQVSRSPSHS